MTFPPIVALEDRVGLTDTERQRAADLGEAWINDRLAPAVNRFATVGAYAPGEIIPPEAWPISLWTHETVEGALGHHDIDEKNRRPFGIVGMSESGAGWLKTWLHELGELLKNPWCDRLVMIGRRLYVDEPCDAVEDDVDSADPSYSNLVLDAYYDPEAPGPVDFLGTLPGPIQIGKDPPITAGGYVAYLDLDHPELGWQQFTGARAVSRKAAPAKWSRRGRLFTRHGGPVTIHQAA